jgi:hypothetical protein|tara:strand:- start:730 stop:876 length:147 start_codon:yes stop_codon:yes gene_type:complete
VTRWPIRREILTVTELITLQETKIRVVSGELVEQVELEQLGLQASLVA